jgi:hypothetical protein
MALTATVPDPRDFMDALVPAGTHPAALVGIIDLGTQLRAAFEGGKAEWKHMVYLCFEVFDEDARPLIGRAYTFSLSEKASLRGILKALKGGKDVAPGEQVNFRGLLGKACQVVVEHGEGKEKRPYARLTNVVGPPKGFKAPAVAHSGTFWEIDSGETFPDAEWLGEQFLWGKRLLEWLEQSREWGGDKRSAGAPANGQPDTPF